MGREMVRQIHLGILVALVAAPGAASAQAFDGSVADSFGVSNTANLLTASGDANFAQASWNGPASSGDCPSGASFINNGSTSYCRVVTASGTYDFKAWVMVRNNHVANDGPQDARLRAGLPVGGFCFEYVSLFHRKNALNAWTYLETITVASGGGGTNGGLHSIPASDAPPLGHDSNVLVVYLGSAVATCSGQMRWIELRNS